MSIFLLPKKSTIGMQSSKKTNNKKQPKENGGAIVPPFYFFDLLYSPKDSITSIAEPWANVGVFIKFAVHRANIERNIRIGFAKSFDAFRSRNNANEVKVFS